MVVSNWLLAGGELTPSWQQGWLKQVLAWSAYRGRFGMGVAGVATLCKWFCRMNQRKSAF
jgi:hypothetical protein